MFAISISIWKSVSVFVPRICHCEGEEGAPLLAPCYCSGSLRYVHQACLQQWIKASDTRACELCKFTFIMHAKTKPFCEVTYSPWSYKKRKKKTFENGVIAVYPNFHRTFDYVKINGVRWHLQWEKLEMSALEVKKLWCAVAFHAVAALCVAWSLYVLVERSVEEARRGFVDWSFWTKLIVVVIGSTGGLVFMYIQCKAYITLCRKWRAFNRCVKWERHVACGVLYSGDSSSFLSPSLFTPECRLLPNFSMPLCLILSVVNFFPLFSWYHSATSAAASLHLVLLPESLYWRILFDYLVLSCDVSRSSPLRTGKPSYYIRDPGVYSYLFIAQ